MVLNIVSLIVEVFKYTFLVIGSIPFNFLLISMLTTLIVLLIGVVLFSKVEKT